MAKEKKKTIIHYTVREATESDVPQIDALFAQSLQGLYQTRTTHGYPGGYWENMFIYPPNNTILVAETGGEILGFVSLDCRFEAGNYIVLQDFAVAQHCRNHGIGTQLLHWVHSYARSFCIRTIYVFVDANALVALNLFKNLGYEVYETQGSRVKMLKRP